MEVSSQSAIYNAARDVNGKYNACISYYDPHARITVDFAGYNAKDNRTRFVEDHCIGNYSYNCHVDGSLTIYL